MATRPEQRHASPVELARATVKVLAANQLQMRASPLQGGPLTFLQAKKFQKNILAELSHSSFELLP